MNKAILAKIACRFLTDSEADWCKIVRSKYGVDDLGPVDFKK